MDHRATYAGWVLAAPKPPAAHAIRLEPITNPSTPASSHGAARLGSNAFHTLLRPAPRPNHRAAIAKSTSVMRAPRAIRARPAKEVP